MIRKKVRISYLNNLIIPNHVSVENDASIAKTACSVGHVCKRRIENYSKCSQLTHDCLQMFNVVVCNELTNVLNVL